jgi:hypothetical protein
VTHAARPHIGLGAAFKGLPRSFADDLGVVRSNWRDLFKVQDNLSTARDAWNVGGVRGVASMYVGPGMVDEVGRMRNISRADLDFIGTPDAFRQAFAYNSWALGATGTGAASDTNSLAELFQGEPEIDVTGPDAALVGR